MEGTHRSQRGEQESANPPINNRDLLGQPQPPMVAQNSGVPAQQRATPAPESLIRAPNNIAYPQNPQSHNNSGYYSNLIPPKDISKALTDLGKLYNDDKLKFRGDKY